MLSVVIKHKKLFVVRSNQGVVVARRGLFLVVLALAVFILTSLPAYAAFSDISDQKLNEKINTLVNKNIINGFSDGTFRPSESLTRAQMAKMIVLAKGLSLTSAAEATKPFNDIPNNHWASAFITASLGAGIMKGYPDGSFRPNDKITRAELARLLRRSITVKQINSVKPTYKDVSRTYWAFNEVETVAHYEIMGGYKDGKFHPADPATRAQTAVAIYKVVRDGLADLNANTTQDTSQTSQSNESTVTAPVDDGKIIICIDAGHGGNDPGAIAKSNGLQEKDVNLSVALKLQSLLEGKVDEVVMTRTTDVFVDLSKRAQIANDARADVFVSIHHNSSSTDTASGTAVYSFPGSSAGAELAKLIQEELVKAFGWSDIAGKNDGARTANYAVLRQTAMTAALCESAYMSNPEEAGLLATDAFQQQEAGAVANGILKYLGNNN